MVFDAITVERFWNKVRKGGIEECWEWKGERDKEGYGRVQIAKKRYLAHRISLMQFCSPITPKLLCRHSCDNPSCVSPHHLSWGTSAENVQDKVERNPEWLASYVRRMAKYRRQNSKSVAG